MEQQQQQQHRERKLRLNKMRERTKALLRNHDWEKYFPSAALNGTPAAFVEISQSNQTANQIGANNNHLNCSLSAINHLDYDSLLMQTNINNNIVNNNNNNNINQTPNNKFQLNLMPFLVNTTSQKTINKEENTKTKSSSVVPKQRKHHHHHQQNVTRKPKRMVVTTESTGDEEDDECNYRLNMIPRGIPPSLLIRPVCSSPQYRAAATAQTHHQQSFTFIAELAQTSTPTRNTQAPITSTPKQLTHDPLKYHPKQTIRCKKSSTVATVTAPGKKPLQPAACSCCPNNKASAAKQCAPKQQQQQRQQQQSNKRKRSESFTNNSSSGGEWDCDLCNNLSHVVNSMAVAVSTKKKVSRAVKFKTSNIEISLQDLLYAPTKSTKFDLVTTTRPRVVRKQHSKVYYL